MTLRYSLFGMPQNELEFEDMAKRKGLSINIGLGESEDNYGVGQSVIYQCFPVLQAGGRRLSLDKDAKKHVIILGTKQGNLERLTIQDQVFNRILNLASTYQSRGFQVTIGDKSIEEARTEVDRYNSEQRKEFTA